MNIKKVLLLSSMALALVAFVVPASASALTLKDSGAEVVNKEAELRGPISFSSLGGGIQCEGDAKITVNGQVVRVSSLTITTTTCVGSGGLAGCTVTGDSVTNIPWTIDVDATLLTITGVTIHNTLSPTTGKTCSPKTLKIEFAVVKATPDSTTAIHSVSISGEGAAFIEGVEVEAEAHGSLNVQSTDSGTYAIG